MLTEELQFKKNTHSSTLVHLFIKNNFMFMNTPNSILFVVPTLTFKTKSIIDKSNLGQ